LKRSGIAFNCVKEDREGTTIVKCEPIEKRGEIREKLVIRPILLRQLEDGKFDLIDDGGATKDIIKELNDYLKYLE
jgi:hypothetical protein